MPGNSSFLFAYGNSYSYPSADTSNANPDCSTWVRAGYG
jgi:hypothetical protein